MFFVNINMFYISHNRVNIYLISEKKVLNETLDALGDLFRAIVQCKKSQSASNFF